MERVGEKLRRRREELGFTIEDIARATKYRPDVIQAIEEGRTGVFPAEAYRQAFLRAYAVKLGLDPAEVVREQKSEEERVQEALKGIRLKPRTRPGLRRTLVWLVVVVGVAAALLVLYDRVIKVRGLGERTGEAAGPGIQAAESTLAGRPDSQAVAAPFDSAEVDRGIEEDLAPEIDESEGSAVPGETEAEAPGEAAASDERSAGEAAGGPAQGEITDQGEAIPEAAGAAGPEEEEEEEDEPESARPGAAVPGEAAGRDWLAVWIQGYAVKARLRAGDSILVNRWLRSGFRDTFYSNEPFWADTIIANENSMLLVLNGEQVDLPSSRDNVITDFRISP